MGVSLLVNAGGQSRRMGRDKALLPAPGGAPLIAHIINRLRSRVDGAVVVVANQPDLAARAGLPPDVRVVPDRWPQSGALGGIATGLRTLSGWCMCVACDMPFVCPAIMAGLLAVVGERAVAGERVLAAVPVWQGRHQPFHAVYHAALAGHLERALAKGELQVSRALENAPLVAVDATVLGPEHAVARAFWNVNTPDDWEQALRWFDRDEPRGVSPA